MGAGRPTIPENERRSKYLTIPLTEDEIRTVQEIAERVGKKPATWCRDMVLRAAKRQHRSS